jgi:hypothetical protein
MARFQLANACGATAAWLGDACQPSRYAHRAGPDPEAERQYSARECVVQAIGGELGKTHLGQHCGAQFWLKDRRRLRGKICSGGAAGSMQGDGYPIAGERGDYCCLIADAVEPIFGCAAEVTVRDMSDGDRFVEQRLRTVKPHREVGTVLLHLREKALPAKTRTCKIPPLHHTAEIRNAVFHRLDTTVASGIERQLGGVRQLSGLGGRQPVIHLEADPLVRVLRATVAAQIVFARGEKGGWSFVCGAVVERSLPEVRGRAAERLHTATALNADSRGDGCGDERCIERLARERGFAGNGNGAVAARLAAARRTKLMGTAPREATSMPSACRSSRASPLRNSPQTLWRGVGSRSINVTLRPFRASAIEAAQPATPPPRMRTSSCKALLLIHWMFKQFVAGFHTSSRRPKTGTFGASFCTNRHFGAGAAGWAYAVRELCWISCRFGVRDALSSWPSAVISRAW